jgi:LmbE family N-acetylglucosaminyl deacetylase
MSSVLVVGAHPDDEAIGCGGALRRHALAGDDVSAVFLTSGEGGGHGLEHPGEIREREAHEAARILGIRSLRFLREPDGRLRASRDVIDRVAELIGQTRASLVYAPHRDDDHPDHRCAARIVRRAIAQAAVPVQLWHYEIWSPLAQVDHVIDISAVIGEKLNAIRAYPSQNSIMRFDEAFRGLARYRGEMHSWPGGPYAEVFSA